MNSVHDMNVINGVTRDDQGRVCAFCHSPHHALDQTLASEYNPLWSHQQSGITNYTQYDSTTLDASKNGTIDALIGPSRLCMSCHDGTVAIDAHYSFVGMLKFTGDTYDYLDIIVEPQIAVGGNANLSNDHPIGFKISDVYGIDNGIFDIAGTSTTFRDTTRLIRLGLYQLGGEFYFTCATCHDVHNKDNFAHTGLAAGRNYLVYADQNGSKLCLSCHDK